MTNQWTVEAPAPDKVTVVYTQDEIVVELSAQPVQIVEVYKAGPAGARGVPGEDAEPLVLTVSASDGIAALVEEEGVAMSVSLSLGDITPDSVSTGALTHTGLVPSSGMEVDQLKTETISLLLSTEWQDTTLNADDIVTGTYIVQVYANDASNGGTNKNEFYSGIMSWFSGATDGNETDEIALHRAGASADGNIYLRTRRGMLSETDLVLEIRSNIENTAANNYVFKFRRVI